MGESMKRQKAKYRLPTSVFETLVFGALAMEGLGYGAAVRREPNKDGGEGWWGACPNGLNSAPPNELNTSPLETWPTLTRLIPDVCDPFAKQMYLAGFSATRNDIAIKRI